MKRVTLLCSSFLLAVSAFAQYQLPNSDFEGGNYTSKGEKNVLSYVPNSWHWLLNSSSTYSATGSSGAISTGTRATISMQNSNGNKFVRLTQFYYYQAVPITNVQVCGLLTTGRINIGSGSDKYYSIYKNQSKIYTYSDTNENTNNWQSFTGKPDSLSFKYALKSKNANDVAMIKVVVHGKGRYQSPEQSTDYSSILWGKVDYSAPSTSGTMKTVTEAFSLGSKSSDITPAAVLVHLQTNYNIGNGNENDYLDFDDIKFIYNSRLSKLIYDGSNVPGFQKNDYSYVVAGDYYEGCLVPTVDGNGASYTISYDESTRKATIVVKGNDWTTSNRNEHSYVVEFNPDAPVDPGTPGTENTGIYQLPNGDFEAGSSSGVPNGWHWFNTAVGNSTYINYAKNSKLDILTYTNTTNHYIRLTQSTAWGQQVNGNLTTGIINVGSSTATDASSNYNYSDPSKNVGQKFTGHPDSISFKYAASLAGNSEMGLRLYIHGNGRVQDPKGSNNYETLVWGNMAFLSGTTGNQFVNKTMPITIDNKNVEPAAILISLSTNKTAGQGSSGDNVSLDDIKFIYNSQLASLKVDGNMIAGFQKNVYDYVVDGDYNAEKFEALADGNGATTSVRYDKSTRIVTITVKGEDWSVTNNNQHVYTVRFGKVTLADSQLSSIKFNGTEISGFNKNVYEYSVSGDYSLSNFSAFANDANANVSVRYNSATRTATITVKGADYTTDNDNQHVYTVKFIEVVLANAQLSSLVVNNQAVDGFSADVYSYTVKGDYNATAFSAVPTDAASLVTVDYDETTRIATITVVARDYTAENGNRKIYTVKFDKIILADSYLSALTYDGVAVEGFQKDVYDYTIEANYDAAKLVATIAEGASKTVVYDDATHIATITVKGSDWTIENNNQHIYEITFIDKVAPEVDLTGVYQNQLDVRVGSPSEPATSSFAAIKLIKNENGTYQFVLNNFSFSGINVGDIVLTDVPVTTVGDNSTMKTTQTLNLMGMDLNLTMKGKVSNGVLTANLVIALTETENVYVDILETPFVWTKENRVITVKGGTLTEETAPMVVSLSEAGCSFDLRQLTGTATINNVLPNVVVYANDGVMGSNVVVNGICQSFEVVDGSVAPYVSESFKAVAASYNHSFRKGKSATFVLPFPINVPTDWTVGEFTNINSEKVSCSIVATTKANVPYVMQANDDATTTKMAASDVVIPVTPDTIFVVKQDASLIGAYKEQDVADAYIFSNGSFVKNDHATVSSFTAYLVAPNMLATSLPVSFTQTVGINTIGGASKVDVYTVSGVKIKSNANITNPLVGLPAGAYIVNGKTLVK